MIFSQIVLVYGTYIVATASPGPSNMAIMATAMRVGRVPALALAAGVITGTLFWAVLAATGMAAVLAAYAQALFVIKIAGGFYLLFLAFRAGQSALRSTVKMVDLEAARPKLSYRALYRQGVIMHICNPKAVLGWITIMSLGLPNDAHAGTLSAIIGGCAVLAVIVFGSYAVLFSTAPMVAIYEQSKRWIEGGLCALFASAGLTLIASNK
ncbi:LysE family translocator [Prosthecomicrobium sp. N25]|uniref:LysE family translocator n=1 Tax=Prosthecomicrobium sp. N25 TaxID=3129254 RepID=UPI00307713FD